MANLYDLKRFDLNLLVIFECIYQHLSISKAAETLFITPSAVSQSLQRLRTQLNDPLFVRAGKGITPTTVAVNLHHHLSENLNQIEQTINMMENSTLDKRFIIYGPQVYFSEKFTVMFGQLLREPNLNVEYHDFSGANDNVENLLTYRKADIVFTTSPLSNRALVCEPFIEIPTVLVSRNDHPRLGNFASIDEVLNESFTFYDTQDSGIKQYQYASENFLMERRCAFRSSSLTAIISTIHHTDLIGLLPLTMFNVFKDTLALKRITLPVELPKITIYKVYNRAVLHSELFTKIINAI